MTRIESVLAKKARLGVDAWGSTDEGVRHLLAPIETLFAREFPRFSPYPWGAPRWIAGHIRHVMLAEAMVDDFANAFSGVGPDDAESLADAFAFSECVVRERLVAILQRSLEPSFPV